MTHNGAVAHSYAQHLLPQLTIYGRSYDSILAMNNKEML